MKLVMKRALSLWSVAILTFCGILALAGERTTAPVVENVRLGVHKSGQTRVVIDMDAAPGYVIVPQDKGGPEIVVLIENMSVNFGGNELPGARGLVEEVRVEDSRLVIDLDETALPAKDFVLEPTEKNEKYRLVLDLEAAGATDFAAATSEGAVKLAAFMRPASETPAAAKKPADIPAVIAQEMPDETPPLDIPSVVKAAAAEEIAGNPKPMTRIPRLRPGRTYSATQPQSSSGKLVIVIDPGHGGHDPGAIGSTGLEEKRVTWSAAKALGKELTSRGYQIVYTRQGDEFVALDQRIEIARLRQADMFISLHADANPVASVRGASVYTLSEDRNEQMALEATSQGDFRLFDREISSEDREVSSILYDLANTDTKNQSERLASSLIRRMKGRVLMVNNTHRHASLVVLLSPDVPAVLIELSFMSNTLDEANLGSRTWRQNTVVAIADGIDDYFAQGRRAGLAIGSARGN